MESPPLMSARFPLVLLVALVVQRSLLAHFHVGDVRPDGLLLVAIAAGAVAGSERGAVAGFMAGLLADLFAQTPFGLSALTYAVVAFAVGAIQSGLLRAAWWLAPVTALIASAAGVLLFAVAGAVIGQTQFMHADLLTIATVVAVVNAVLSLPAMRVMGWALAGPEAAR